VITDGNPGLTRAVKQVFPGVRRQRCQVHKLRNILAKLPKVAVPHVRPLLQQVFLAPDHATGLHRGRALPDAVLLGHGMSREGSPRNVSPTCSSRKSIRSGSTPRTCSSVPSRSRAAGPRSFFTPHSLRHTFASILLSDGVSPAYVQRQLGHASIKLTVDTYGKWLPMENKAAVDRLDTPEMVAAWSRMVAEKPKTVAD